MRKKTKIWSGWGRQKRRYEKMPMCTTVPKIIITKRPVYFIIVPKIIEHIAFTMPKTIMMKPI
jgi:hypothetical protein